MKREHRGARSKGSVAVALVAVALLGVGGTAIGAIACAEPKRPDGGSGLLPPGSPAPDMQGSDANGRPVKLSDGRGRARVVYFYPKDGTPGCTKEACAFRDAFAKYDTAGITIFGVSRDSEESHRAFREKHRLPFPLVSDTSGAVQHAYGVSSFLGMPSRVTFVVGADGTIAQVFPDVDPGVHAEEVLAAAARVTTASALGPVGRDAGAE